MNWKKMTWKMLSLIALGAVIFLWLIKAPVMSWYLSNVMKTRVSVATISMWPTETTIRYFAIHNPSGYRDRKALEVKKTTILYQLKSLRAAHSEIDQIELQDVDLLIDCANPLCTENNWKEIAKGTKSSKKEEKSENSGTTIKKLVLLNLTVVTKGVEMANAVGAFNVPEKIHFDRMEFDNVDSSDGFPTKELIMKIFKEAGMNKYVDGAFNAPGNAIKGLFGD